MDGIGIFLVLDREANKFSTFLWAMENPKFDLSKLKILIIKKAGNFEQFIY